MSVRLIPTITEPVYPRGWPNPDQRTWPWTAREIQVLRERYIPEGAGGCLALLPGRTAVQVYNKVVRLGLKRQKEHERRPDPPPGLDAALRAHYCTPPHQRQRLRVLGRRFGWPASWLYLRARELGLDVTRRAPRGAGVAWEAGEDAILRAHATLALPTLRRRLHQAGYLRTESAIYARLSRLGLRREAREAVIDDGYTARDLAQAMGEDVHVVTRWIKAGWLQATRRADLPGAPLVIRHQAVRAFLLAYPSAWDHRRCDKWWLISALVPDAGALDRRGAA